jgi:single-strand DNA-binding protein
MAPSVTHVTGGVEIRFTQDGIAVCRFRLTETPTQWDAAAQRWRDLDPIRYICTAWRDLASNAAESLVDGVNVLAKGRITGAKDDSIYLGVDDIAIGLPRRIAYTETSLPSPAAAAPVTPPPTPQPSTASRAATRRPRNPPRLVGREAVLRLTLSGSRRRHSPSRPPLIAFPFVPFARPGAASVRLPVPRPAKPAVTAALFRTKEWARTGLIAAVRRLRWPWPAPGGQRLGQPEGLFDCGRSRWLGTVQGIMRV